MSNSKRQNLLSDSQFAYRKGRSTQDCLLLSTNFKVNALNGDSPVDVIYTNFKNAFETMPQEVVLSLLPQEGVGAVPVMRNLGVLISDRLSYGEHVEFVVKRSSIVVS